MNVKPLLATCIAAAFILTGCLSDAPRGDPGQSVVELSLADLACDFLYPDNGTTIPCESPFTVVEPQEAEAPSFLSNPPSVCIYQPADGLMFDVEIYWDATSDTYTLYYHAPDVNGTLSGIFYTRLGEEMDGKVSMVWHNGPTRGLVEIPAPTSEYREQQNFVLRFYSQSYESDTPELQGGTVRTLWNFFNDQPYPIQVIETDSGEYFFNEVEYTEHATYPYDMESFTMDGTDFNVTVETNHHLNVRSSFNPMPIYQCTL
jgi:hypothetical protein